MRNDERLTAKQFQESGGVEEWRVLASGASAWFDAPSHAAGAALVRRIAELSGTSGRMPVIDLRATGVRIRVGATDSSGFGPDDVEAARAISTVARDLGLRGEPSAMQDVQLTFDALDKAAVMPFWHAALGYEPIGDADLVDPMRRDPSIWFQQQDEPRPLRNRVHIDISRPESPTRESLEALGGSALYVGGYHTRFSDAEGNEADVVVSGTVDDEPGTADWRVVFGAMAFYAIDDPSRSAELAAVVAGLADDAGMPLLVDLRADGVTIDTGKDQWEDERFPALARRIQTAARGMGLTADPTRLRFVQIGIDALDIPAVRGFWRAVLGYEFDTREFVTDIYDPRRLNLPLFFQPIDESEEDRRRQRNRIHVDVFVPDDQAAARVDAALAAGGRIVYDDEAPEWWTLADPEGNEVDIAVSVGREELWLAAQAASD